MNIFKRVTSSILAFVMLCSCVVVMNVGVMAADTTWNFNNTSSITASASNDLGNGLTYVAGSSDKVNSDLESYGPFNTLVASDQNGVGIRTGGKTTYGNKRYFSYKLASGSTITAYYVRHSADTTKQRVLQLAC